MYEFHAAALIALMPLAIAPGYALRAMLESVSFFFVL
jgi:hypothetical protein